MSVWIMCNKLFHYVQQKERMGSFYGQKISLAFCCHCIFFKWSGKKKWQQCQTFVKIGLKTITTGICFASEMKWQGFHIMKTCLFILCNHASGVTITYLNVNNTHKYCLLQNRMKMASKPKKCGSCPSIFKMPCIENKCLKINWQTFNDFCLTHRQQQKRTIR